VTATDVVRASRWRPSVPRGAIAGALLAGGLAAWLLGTSTGSLREELKWLQYWSLECCVFTAVILSGPVIRKVGQQLTRRDAVQLASLAGLAVALTVLLGPRTNRIYYDEQIYQAIGQNLADLRLAQVCNDGSVEYGRLSCSSGEYNKQPYAYPHLLSLFYRLLGTRPWIAFAVNAAAAGATAAAVYLLSLLLFGDRSAAVLGSVALTLMPEQIMWSATAAVEPTASLACLIAVLSAAIFLRVGGLATLAMMAVTSAYAAQFRPESLLVCVVVAGVAWPRLRTTFERDGAWWVLALFVVLLGVHVAHLYAVRQVEWGTQGARFSLRFVIDNLRVNGAFYVFDERFPVIFTALAVIGAVETRLRRHRFGMVLYFALFFGVYLLFHAGSYNYGADVRYSLTTYPPVAILTGLGAAALGRRIRRHAPLLPIRAIAATAFGFVFLAYAPVVRGSMEEAWAARADVAFARGVVLDLPRHSYVLTHNPGMFHVWGRNAGQMSLVTGHAGYLEYLEGRYPGGVYLHWNFWCNVQDPSQQSICRTARDLRPGELIRQHAERGQYFAFYRLGR
jgi:hypothetical protein